jgi:hypothetical protein
MFVLSTQFLKQMFKLSINWHVVVICNTLNWKSGGKKNLFSVMISYLICCLQGFKIVPGEQSHVPYHHQILCNYE